MDILGQPLWIGFFLGIMVGGVLFNKKFRDSTLSFLFPKYRQKMQARGNVPFGNNNSNINQQTVGHFATQGTVIIDPYTGTQYHMDWNCSRVMPKEKYYEYGIQQLNELETFKNEKFKPCPICVRGS